jgi:hypothetical protein
MGGQQRIEPVVRGDEYVENARGPHVAVMPVMNDREPADDPKWAPTGAKQREQVRQGILDRGYCVRHGARKPLDFDERTDVVDRVTVPDRAASRDEEARFSSLRMASEAVMWTLSTESRPHRVSRGSQGLRPRRPPLRACTPMLTPPKRPNDTAHPLSPLGWDRLLELHKRPAAELLSTATARVFTRPYRTLAMTADD